MVSEELPENLAEMTINQAAGGRDASSGLTGSSILSNTRAAELFGFGLS